MDSLIEKILGPSGAIARRLGQRYEHRPEQMEMAHRIAAAVEAGEHLLAEAGTGVGKSFAYLVPVIDWAVRNKKRVVVSTHTIALQEQLIDKDIPLIRAVFPQEFAAVLVKGRGNYLCQRRLEQARGRQGLLFETSDEMRQLEEIEAWAAKSAEKGGGGSLSELPVTPLPQVWDKVAAEHGNCMGKKCKHYDGCFWQAAKRRMQSGNVLVVNHALFFSDLALRMAGVNYLPKYDVVVLDEAHTVEEVAGQHFGIKVSEAGVKYNLRTLYDMRRGKGMLSAFGPAANDAIMAVMDLGELTEDFFHRVLEWQETTGRSSGRIREAGIVENTLTPALKALTHRLRGLTATTEKEEEIAELSAMATKIEMTAAGLDALITQGMPDAVYWLDTGNTDQRRGPRRITWHAAPIDIAEGLKRGLWSKMHSVIMTSATLCTAAGEQNNSRGSPPAKPGGRLIEQRVDRGRGVSPLRSREAASEGLRRGAALPHLTPQAGIFAVNFRLADSIPADVAAQWRAEKLHLTEKAKREGRQLSQSDRELLNHHMSEEVDAMLDRCEGECLLRDPRFGQLVADALRHFDGDRYSLLAWCVMPNHVHAVVKPLEGHSLPGIVQSWKSFTAHEINRQLGRSGSLWLEESYDRLIRDENELWGQVEYAFRNAENAGLKGWDLRGRNEEAIAEGMGWLRGSPLRDEHGRNAPATGSASAGNSRAQPSHELGETNGSWDPDSQLDPEDLPSPPAPPAPASPPEFLYIARRVGVAGLVLDTVGRPKDVGFLRVGSPFEFERQCRLFVEGGLPDPGDRLFPTAAREKVIHYLRMTHGGAFVLFTSYKQMLEMARDARNEIAAMGLPMLVQGEGISRKALLEKFRAEPNSVLFGTSSFWQGVDVQGDSLRNVIIVKLPFAVPDEPLVEAKLEAITRDGGNAFMEFSVPEAIIKLKQGFGRLIRSKTDTGIVVILDSRVVTKRYGRMFLAALPKCALEVKR